MDFYKIFLSAHKGFGYLELALVALFTIALLTTMFGFSGKVNKFLKKTTKYYKLAKFRLFFNFRIFNFVSKFSDKLFLFHQI